MVTEKRLQIYLPEKDYKLLRERAIKENKSMSQAVREAIREALMKTGDRDEINEGYERLKKIIGMFRDGADVAENHDQFLNL